MSRSMQTTQFGQYGTHEFMRRISEKGRQTLEQRYGGDWAQVLGNKSKKAIRAKYGKHGHANIGKIGGDSTACKYWNKHCENREDNYDRLNSLSDHGALPALTRERTRKSDRTLRYSGSRLSAGARSAIDDDWSSAWADDTVSRKSTGRRSNKK